MRIVLRSLEKGCWTKEWPLKDTYVSVFEASVLASTAKGDLSDIIKWSMLRWRDFPGSSGRLSVITRVHIGRKQVGQHQEWVREETDLKVWHFWFQRWRKSLKQKTTGDWRRQGSLWHPEHQDTEAVLWAARFGIATGKTSQQLLPTLCGIT